MRFFRTLAMAAVAAPWLLQGALAGEPAGADAAVETTIIVAYATGPTPTASEAIGSQAGDARRVSDELRAAVRAELDAAMADNVQSLLAAAGPRVDGD